MQQSPTAAETPAPLRKIVDRPTHMLETLECGHTIQRPLGLGEFAMGPSKVKSRRCWKCGEGLPVFEEA